MMKNISLKFYNTQTGQKEVFIPANPKRVSAYLCGPTVYGPAHIGNARPAIMFDVLRRLVKTQWRPHFISNLTDIDDKIMAAAKQKGVGTDEIADIYAAQYAQDMKALGVAVLDAAPRASEHIAEIIEMITALVEKNHAYIAEGHVLFSVRSFPDYGSLSHRSLDEMVAGARVEIAPYKKDAADFVLWKPSSDDQPGWQSPWGRGRPGWHIECSAMIHAHLGKEIDIHAAGADLIFPHHENERAQSICVHGGQLARFWIHNALVIMEGDKMSKSIGNTLLLKDLLQRWSGEVLRLALLMTHYRQPLYWTEETPARAKNLLDRFYRSLRQVAEIAAPPVEDEKIYTALADDLNTPKFFTYLSDLVKQIGHEEDRAKRALLKGKILYAGGLVGLLQQSPDGWFMAGTLSTAKITQLIAERWAAKKEKNFAVADQIRDQLVKMDVILEDHDRGTDWRYKR